MAPRRPLYRLIIERITILHGMHTDDLCDSTGLRLLLCNILVVRFFAVHVIRYALGYRSSPCLTPMDLVIALTLRTIRLDSRNLDRTSSDVIRSKPVTVGPGRVRIEFPVFIWLRHDCEGNLLQVVADMATVIEYGFTI